MSPGDSAQPAFMDIRISDCVYRKSEIELNARKALFERPLDLFTQFREICGPFRYGQSEMSGFRSRFPVKSKDSAYSADFQDGCPNLFVYRCDRRPFIIDCQNPDSQIDPEFFIDLFFCKCYRTVDLFDLCVHRYFDIDCADLIFRADAVDNQIAGV